jgi:hypothetical protein
MAEFGGVGWQNIVQKGGRIYHRKMAKYCVERWQNIVEKDG